MSEPKTVWVNLDPRNVDLTPIVSRCEKAGYRCITKDIGTDTAKAVEMALQADAIVSIGEQWNQDSLPQIAGSNRIIVRYGAGLDNVNVPLATQYGIPVANLPGMNSPAVAEIALLHILNLGRRFSYSIEGIKQGHWPYSMPGNELDGKVLGLIGFGNIARQLTRMVQGFSLKIMAYDNYLNEAGRAFAQEHNVTLTQSAEEIYLTADIVSLHIPYTPANRGIVNKDCFAIMKPTAYLVNTCRGGVICEKDLIDALRTGQIRGAGLDVLCEEPPSMDNPLLHMDNVFVSSHLGSLAVEAEERSQLLIADIIDEHFAGRIHRNVVNPQALANH